MTHSPTHLPVMLQEVLESLAIKPNGIYIDGTFGRGGHSQAILKALGPQGRLICFDKDPTAIAEGQALLGQDSRVSFHHGCFSQMEEIITALGFAKQIDGILLDLGVSSPQLDTAERGFSFMRDGPLDMRMDTTRGMSAQEWLATAEFRDLVYVLKVYGEENLAKKIAQKIDERRRQQPITTTKQLADLVKESYPMRKIGHHHPATKTFQGIRIHINQELQAVETALQAGLAILAPMGHFSIISFHSLEDRLVKRFFRAKSQSEIPKEIAIRHDELVTPLNWIIKRQFPTEAEISVNQRARSATLRAAQRNKEDTACPQFSR